MRCFEWQMFDGLLLSDAQLVRGSVNSNPYFSLGLSGKQRIVWLEGVRNSLASVGLSFSDKYPTTYDCVSHSKPYVLAKLDSRSMAMLTQEYNRWYGSGKKIVPLDLELLPATVAYWFMGDGHSSYKRSQHTKPGYSSVEVGLSTNKFTLSEVELLIKSLRGLAFSHAGLWKVRHDIEQYRIRISEANNVIAFMDMVKPFITEPFMYKVKYPVLSHKWFK